MAHPEIPDDTFRAFFDLVAYVTREEGVREIRTMREISGQLQAAVSKLPVVTADDIPAQAARVAAWALEYARGYGVTDPGLNPALRGQT